MLLTINYDDLSTIYLYELPNFSIFFNNINHLSSKPFQNLVCELNESYAFMKRCILQVACVFVQLNPFEQVKVLQ